MGFPRPKLSELARSSSLSFSPIWIMVIQGVEDWKWKKHLIFLQIISSKFIKQNLKEEEICKIFTTKDPVLLGDFFAKKTLVTANTLQSFHVLFLFVGELGNKKSKQS